MEERKKVDRKREKGRKNESHIIIRLGKEKEKRKKERVRERKKEDTKRKKKLKENQSSVNQTFIFRERKTLK